MKWSLIEEKFIKVLMKLSLFIVLGSLFTVILVILYKGAGALSISMMIQTPKGGYYLGKEGGILNAIVGSLYLGLGATGLAIIFSLPIAFCLQREYLTPRIDEITLSANIMNVSTDRASCQGYFFMNHRGCVKWWMVIIGSILFSRRMSTIS